MKKIIGFKMMLGEWVNELENHMEILDFHATKLGVGNIKSNKLNKNGENTLPENIMFDYDPITTIMSFRFNKPYNKEELPEYFIEGSNGIIIGESNCELIYET